MRFHLDEHVPDAVAEGLRRRGIDVTTTGEAGLSAAPDVAHLEFTRRTNRISFTEDDDFLALAQSGLEHNGIVYGHQQAKTVGQIVEHLILIDGCLTEDDMRNHVEFC